MIQNFLPALTEYDQKSSWFANIYHSLLKSFKIPEIQKTVATLFVEFILIFCLFLWHHRLTEKCPVYMSYIYTVNYSINVSGYQQHPYLRHTLEDRGWILGRKWDKSKSFPPCYSPLLISKSGLKLVCNLNIVYWNLKCENWALRLCD